MNTTLIHNFIKRIVTNILLITILLINISCSNISQPDESDLKRVEHLIAIINKRIELTTQMADLKFPSLDRVYDANREIQVLANAEQIANQYDLPINEVLIYAQLNMDLSKQIQNYVIQQYIKEHKSPYKKKNIVELRSEILILDSNFFAELAEVKQSPIKSTVLNIFNTKAIKEIVLPNSKVLQLQKIMLLN